MQHWVPETTLWVKIFFCLINDSCQNVSSNVKYDQSQRNRELSTLSEPLSKRHRSSKEKAKSNLRVQRATELTVLDSKKVDSLLIKERQLVWANTSTGGNPSFLTKKVSVRDLEGEKRIIDDKSSVHLINSAGEMGSSQRFDTSGDVADVALEYGLNKPQRSVRSV